MPYYGHIYYGYGDSITKEDVAAFLRRNLTAERAVLSEIVPREN